MNILESKNYFKRDYFLTKHRKAIPINKAAYEDSHNKERLRVPHKNKKDRTGKKLPRE